ncbi:MAG TPA: trypsin-like peptidase domain-containing protein [Candidatus Bathyarchaeia archaeon]|nr:trypsin-like peptidase domain-containing protein [Candidatus Bathyarchaeia archaeon]
MKCSVLAVTIAAAVLAGLAASAQPVSPVLQEIEQSFENITNVVRPVVVNIDTKTKAEAGGEADMDQFEDIFRFFGIPFQTPEGGMPRPRRQRAGQASGFIYDSQGHIVTNNHVVKGATEIEVGLWNGQKLPAKVIGTDPDTDLAVIKVDNGGTNLPVAELGDSSQLKVGQFAIAAGSPRGFEGSFSFGHISALGRDLNLPENIRFQNFIQTDAAINLGNSGGPLCNIAGEVIGINIAIVYGANSLGFAIPINTAKNIVPTLIAEGKIVRGYLGVRVTTVDQYAEALNLPDHKGAFVAEVPTGTPAEKAGIQTYDVIRQVNGQPINTPQDLIQTISSIRPGTAATVTVWREGQLKDIQVTLGEFPREEQQAAEAPNGQETLGLRLQNLTEETAQRLQLPPGTRGVLVVGINPDSPAERAGLMQGNVIVEVGQRKVANLDEFHAVLKERAQPGRPLLLGVVRPTGERGIVVIQVPQDASFQ